MKLNISVVAGPNGSGKTTFAESFFQNGKKQTYINPDIIASGLSPGQEHQEAIRVGRVTLQTVKDRIKNKEQVAFESTLSGKTWRNILLSAKANGYFLTIYFLFLKDPKLNLKRIEERVKRGGHSVDRKVVLRRHKRCFENFWHLYRPLCDSWNVFDNSGPKPKQLLSKKDWESLPREKQEQFESDFLRGFSK